jgi:hypothetical protein
VGIIADASDSECRGASLPKDIDAEMLAACWQVEQHVELIENKGCNWRGNLVINFTGMKFRRGL